MAIATDKRQTSAETVHMRISFFILTTFQITALRTLSRRCTYRPRTQLYNAQVEIFTLCHIRMNREMPLLFLHRQIT